MREELVRVDVGDPPHGGGAGPYNPATGQGGIRPIPGEQTQTQIRDAGTEAGLLQIWMTPHGFLKAAAANQASVTTAAVNGRTLHTVSFTALGKYPVRGTINDRNLVERVETRIANPLLGDMPIEATYSDYKDFGGVMFPTRIVQRQGGHPTLDVTVGEVQPNSAAALAVSGSAPRAARARGSRWKRRTSPTASGFSPAARRSASWSSSPTTSSSSKRRRTTSTRTASSPK